MKLITTEVGAAEMGFLKDAAELDEYQKAARKSDADVAPESEAAMAKVTGSRAAVEVTRDAIQVHCGYGFVRRPTAEGTINHLESIGRDSKVGEIYGGANEVRLWSIARVALGRDLTG